MRVIASEHTQQATDTVTREHVVVVCFTCSTVRIHRNEFLLILIKYFL